MQIEQAVAQHYAHGTLEDAILKARGASGAPPPLGLHIVMGASAGQKVKNMMGDITAGLIAPTEMICRVAA